MSLIDLYSRRKKQELSESLEIYVYDKFDQKIRIQILHIVHNAFGDYTINGGYRPHVRQVYDFIAKTLREELGVFELTQKSCYDTQDELKYWLLEEKKVEHILDYIELAFSLINTHFREKCSLFNTSNEKIDYYISSLNQRLEEAGIGYRFVENIIIRSDSEFIHNKVVIPSLNLTYMNEFSNVNKEYIKAHDHYRNNENEACLVECAKAFESTLKIIGSNLNWIISNDDNCSKLINAAVSNDFLNPYLDNGFNSLRSLLESGIPTPRNKAAGHGAGTQSRTIPTELAAYLLHQTAAAIVFLISRYRASYTESTN